MRKLLARVDAALLILFVGFGFSLAANLLWTWPGGIVRILGGALASLALPGAIHLWDKIPLPPPVVIPLGPWLPALRIPVMRVLRALTMTGIAAMAAFTTFSHASSLLVAHGEDPVLAALYPIMTELLVVMGVLARKTPTPARSARPTPKPRSRRDETPSSPVATALEPSGPAPSAPTLDTARRSRDDRVAWAVKHWPVTGQQIADEFGVSRGEGDRNRARAKTLVEAAS